MGRQSEIFLHFEFYSKSSLLILMLFIVNNYDMREVYESSSHTLPATKINNIRCKAVTLCVLNFFLSHLFHFTFSVKHPWRLPVGSLIVSWLCHITSAKPFDCCQLLILVVAHHYLSYFNICYPFICSFLCLQKHDY